ncbi:putative c2h2 type zinc finger domain protein [Botrytis fragariae]|uniref:Putative c2h2 type zinc finger domain protein n=1 Tax=Botrytis fragariae TaxID=1964551 RepID=A0A8H6ELV6_9HELO|nr:putative c2h2 type zinc finger domain protein [Botrytis fragariae]KAF5877081.1 putative c2h2 type zinc finger domain protein [Botrytis fragariae]
MSMHPSYPRNGSYPRHYYPSPPSMHTSDSGYGSTRGEMGPPSLDFPPQPIEIDLSNSRTLPSPSPSSSVAWEPTLFPSPHGFPDLNSPYGPISRMQQLPMDRATGQAPLLQWYADNDGPWYPKTISDPISEERANVKVRSNNRAPVAFGGPYRQQDPLENGSFHFGGPPQSDSGYGTRRSHGNASIFSSDINDRDQDCQSLAGHVADYQPFQGLNEALQSRENTTPETWPTHLPASINSPGLFCQTCQKSVKTKSELKKHDLRHKKPFVCNFPGCGRTEGFSTTNDLDRHTKSKHFLAMTSEVESIKRYRCVVPECKSKDKAWPRLDNFRSHLKRVHSNVVGSEENLEKIIRQAEFLEPSGLPQNAHLTTEASTHDVSHNREVNECSPKAQVIKSNSKPVYPDLIQDLVAPTEIPMEKPLVADVNPSDTAIPGPNNPPADPHTRDTIQPSELFRNPSEVVNKIFLDMSTLVGTKSALNRNLDHVSRPSVERNPLPPAGKATRHSSVSATDATITEAIRTALAEAKNSSNVGALPMGRKVLPNGKSPPADPWGSTTDKAACLLDGFNKSTSSTTDDSLDQEKAIEVYKTLQKLGYIIQKDPNHTPRIQNPGSVASNKSENQVTCEVCKKFKGRPCELKKHMKRHERPYGCTFSACNKTFGSKNDWKRHENSQHFHLETWRCDNEKPEGGACAKVSYRRQAFQEHLKKEHAIIDQDAVKTKVDACRIGRNCQARFWCGFCKTLVDLKKNGLDAWIERFDHIDNHFMGRHGLQKQSIQDWIPVDSDKPKGDVASPNHLGESSPENDHQEHSTDSTDDFGRSSPEFVGNKGTSSTLVGQEPRVSKKRERNDDENDRPSKYTKIGEIVYCCHCADDLGRTLALSPKCTSCNHDFCNECKSDSIDNCEGQKV